MNDEVLSNIKKHLTYEDIIHTLRISKAAGIKNTAMMQIGQYGETEDHARVTYDRLKSAYKEGLIDDLRPYVTQIRTGTELERLAKDEGWYIEQPIKRTQNKVFLGTPWMSTEQIAKWRAAYQEAAPVGYYYGK